MLEQLEARKLLSASVSVLVNGSAPTDPIDFGRVLQNATDPTKTITIKNTGTTEQTGTLDLFNDQDTFAITATTNSTSSGVDFSSFDLQPDQSTTITVGMLTDSVGIRSDEGADLGFTDGSIPDTTLNFTGEVDAASAANFTQMGTLNNGSATTKTGQIKVQEREDGEGNVVDQISDQLYGFHVTAQTTLGLALSGAGTTSTFTGGLMATLLPDQSNGSNTQLTIQERDNPIATLSTQITGTSTATASPTSSSIPAGYYFIYIDSSGAGEAFDNNTGEAAAQPINFTLKTTVQQAAPAAIAVSGDGQSISNGNTSPSKTDGTSFGSAVAGTSESLSFTVSNSGGSALTISGARPDVSGDFIVTQQLPSSIAAGSSATFTVVPQSTSAGSDSGTVSISTNVGKFTFDVSGTFTAPVQPAGITVTGNGVGISSGSTTPSQSNDTSFGSVPAGTSETLTFTVKDTGGSALTFTGTQPTVSGGEFTATALPASIAAGSTATFSITPISTAAGTDSGVVTIQSNAGTFTFDIGGTYTSQPVSTPNPVTTKLTATVAARKLAKAAASYAFTIVYTDNSGILLSSLDNHDVLVTGPNGFRKWARLMSTTVTNKGKTVTAVYHLSPPVGSWTKSLNGNYHIYVRGTVLDSNGNTASVFDASGDPDPLTVVGVFTVHIA